MKTPTILKHLEEAATQLGYKVRKAKGNFRGGRCIVEGEEIIMINRRHQPEQQVVILAESLKGLPVDTLELPDPVKTALEDAWAALAVASQADAPAEE